MEGKKVPREARSLHALDYLSTYLYPGEEESHVFDQGAIAACGGMGQRQAKIESLHPIEA